MSADTQHRSTSNGTSVVLPQPVNDRSIIESVTGFITDVVPSSSATTENKDIITWARFEYADVNDPAVHPEGREDSVNLPPLLLVLGYGSGVQVWSVRSNGEASEILSWRRGVVRTLRILQTPKGDIRDAFAHKRPLVALCDSTGPGPQFCSLSFISLRVGDQVKIIKYKNPLSDVVCSRSVVVVTFPEKLAILDAGTLEERKAVVTCYPTTGPNPNPIALGSRWLAYADKKLLPAHLSAGGAEVYSGQSVTATVLHAAKSFGKGLRDLGDAVASSLAGQRNLASSHVGNGDMHPGVVTILDVHSITNYLRESDNEENNDIVAHFIAHMEQIVALSFDPSGMLLLTADKRGYDFHVFRIFPHPCGSNSAAVHHLYILHRGETTAKVQDIAWSCDSRWVTVSTLRGTTHIYAVTTYGGPIAVRTHATPHVVNRQSRFHRSAGLLADGRNSPETITLAPCVAFTNPRLPPFPHPTTLGALAQVRLPFLMNNSSGYQQQRNDALGRPNARQSSCEEACSIPLKLAVCFDSPRGWIPTSTKIIHKTQKRAVDSLFIISCSGNLVEYFLKPRPAAGIPKEKICDDTPIELEVEANAQWVLLKPPHTSELQLPLSPTNPLMTQYEYSDISDSDRINEDDEHWLSQVEIVTHTGPHRRLWMGPQFVFKTYSNGYNNDCDAIEVGSAPGPRLARSNPVNIPLGSSMRPVLPVLIESTSNSSLEQSPRMYPSYSEDSDSSLGTSDSQLAETLADAMIENPTITTKDQSKMSVDFITL